MLLALEKRVKAGFLALGGGPLSEILAHSKEKGLVKHRDKLLKKHRLSLEEGESILEGAISYDPIKLAKYVDTKKVFLALARWDDVVPYKNGLKLREAMGKPESIIVPAKHYSSVVFIPYIKSQAHQFFQRKFKEEEKKRLEKIVEIKGK